MQTEKLLHINLIKKCHVLLYIILDYKIILITLELSYFTHGENIVVQLCINSSQQGFHANRRKIWKKIYLIGGTNNTFT